MSVAQNLTVADVWAAAPYYSDDAFPPYPDLKNPDGSDVSSASLRGTHLYEWIGCQSKEHKAIKEAYNDFYTLA